MPRSASLEPKKDTKRGRWWISIPPTLSGTGRRQKRYFKTKEAAQGEAQRIKVRKENHGTDRRLLSPADEIQAASALKLLREAQCETQLTVIVGKYLQRLSENLTSKRFDEAWDAYINRSDKNISAPHRRSLKATKNRLAALHEKLVSDISAREIDQALKGASASYRNSLLREIRAVFNWCMGGTRKWLSKNPADECEFSAVAKFAEVAIYTPEQIAQLMAATVKLHPDLVPAMAMMTFAGIRPDHDYGEIVGLDWSHVIHDDTGEERLELPGSITKTGKQRSIKIRPALNSWIQWHFKHGGSQTGAVCPVKGGALRKRLRSIFDESRVKRIQDGLRHSFASYLAPIEGLDTVEAELGHQGGREVLNRHYRTDVRAEVARKFWKLHAPRGEMNALRL